MNFQEILNNFPPSYQNNARSIIKGLLERYVTKPSYYIEQKLRDMGVGVTFTYESEGDYPKPEGFEMLGEPIEMTDMSDWPTIEEYKSDTEEKDQVLATLF